MELSTRSQGLIGQCAWVLAWVGVVVGQLHALARHATVDGASDLEQPLTRAWAQPASAALRPLLDWGDPDTVYLTYGKAWLPVFAAFTLCAFVVRHRRAPRASERIAWFVALAGYVVVTLSIVGAYYTPWLDQAFMFLVVPGLLLSLVGSTALGALLLKNRFRPSGTAWLLTLSFPLALAIAQITSLGNALLPVVFAFGIAGRSIARGPSPSPMEHPRTPLEPVRPNGDG